MQQKGWISGRVLRPVVGDGVDVARVGPGRGVAFQRVKEIHGITPWGSQSAATPGAALPRSATSGRNCRACTNPVFDLDSVPGLSGSPRTTHSGIDLRHSGSPSPSSADIHT